MPLAYIDTSCLVAIAFRESGTPAVLKRLNRYDQLFSSNLLEAELRAAFVREGVEEDLEILDAVSWVIPDRPLSREIAIVLEAGHLRGADCWHLATALYLAPDPGELAFVTLDARQQKVAASLGFQH